MRAAVAALLLMACEPEPGRGVSAPIIGGVPSTPGQFPAVGALYYEGVLDGQAVAQVGCTGTLIAPDVVLTAAHCLDPHVVGMVGLPKFSLDDDTSLPATVWTTAASAMVHEGYVSQTSFEITLQQPDDIGLLLLSQPIGGVAPMQIATGADLAAIAVDLPLEIVGYGQRVAGDNGTIGVEYFAATTVTEVGSNELRLSMPGTPQICLYDSGGPDLAMLAGQRRVVGINSHFGAAGGEDCAQGTISTRVDRYADWIVERAPAVCQYSPDACPMVADAGTPGAADAALSPGPDAGGSDEDGEGCGCVLAPRAPGSTHRAPRWLLASIALTVIRTRARRRC